MSRALKRSFEVNCGNWIFPSKDTTTDAVYPIDIPLVAAIFMTTKDDEKGISKRFEIDHHLTGPRYVDVTVTGARMNIGALRNREEELFEHRVDFSVPFDAAKLARAEHLWGKPEKPGGELPIHPQVRESDWKGIFFTSVLLQHHLKGGEFPEGIYFRKATMPEIEALGTWRS